MDALFSPPCTVSQTVVPDRRRDASIWDPIWTHAIRRANVPGVCRAACHAACVLLSHAKLLLTSQRILVEIETLAKDLDVQGPAFPYDSVCVFLTQCLRVAGQDVRLHRMQIEEKVLSWLLDNWGVGDGSTLKGSSGGQSRMLLYMIGDVLMLLEGICGFSKRVNLIFRLLMPDCPITKTMVEQNKTKVIRDFLLSGCLPPFRNSSKGVAEPVATNDSTSASQSTGNGDLAQPRGRERRISAYLLKSLESFASGFESIREANGYPTAEKARQALDLAVITLSFESSLVLNGTRSTRRAIQGACKSIALITALIPDDRWTPEEKALILLGLEPLISQETEDDEAGWEAIVPPDAGAGIKTQVLRRLISNGESRHAQRRTLRRSLQRIMLQCADVRKFLL
jgi:serine-protein kinase ATM